MSRNNPIKPLISEHYIGYVEDRLDEAVGMRLIGRDAAAQIIEDLHDLNARYLRMLTPQTDKPS